MRDFGGDITAELAAEIKKIFTVIEFQLESGTEYYTDCDIDLYVPHEDAHPDYLSELKLHLKMNEGFGLTVLDSSGNDNDGAITNGEGDEWGPGIVGTGFAPDDNAERVAVSDDATLNPGSGDFSYTFWMQGPNFGTVNHYPLRKYDGGASKGYLTGIEADGTLKAYCHDGTNNVTSQTTTDVDDGDWYFIAVTVDHTTNELQSLYVDGVLEDSDDITAVGDIDVGNAMWLCYTASGLLIDNVQFYKGVVLTKAEVNELYKREYVATDYKLKNMTHTLGMAVDSVTLTFPSAALGWGAQVGNYDIRGTNVFMSNVFLDDNNQVIAGPREMFRGFIDDWNLEQPDIDITFANAFIHWNKRVLRKPGPSCAWPFKLTECAYAGGETWCNQSYVRCIQLANTDQFGGSRFLPSLVAKKIWWGRASVG